MPNTPASARLANSIRARGEATNIAHRDLVRDDTKVLEIATAGVTDAVTDAVTDEEEDEDKTADDSASGFDMVRFL
jgi:hypothetical protein